MVFTIKVDLDLVAQYDAYVDVRSIELGHDFSCLKLNTTEENIAEFFNEFGTYSLPFNFLNAISHLDAPNFLNFTLKDSPYTIEIPNDYPIHAYGVCDEPYQVVKVYSFLQDLDPYYIVTFSRVSRISQPPDGGFRYHKHGPYIGDHENLSEYLYDDYDIDYVYKFSIHEVIPNED